MFTASSNFHLPCDEISQSPRAARQLSQPIKDLHIVHIFIRTFTENCRVLLAISHVPNIGGFI